MSPLPLRLAAFSLLLTVCAHAQKEVAYAPLTDGSLPGQATLYGLSVAGGGDVNGDGVPDFAVGAPGASNEAGCVHVYSGATGSLLYGAPLLPMPPAGVTGGHYQFGTCIDISRDFNGDGKADILVGAQQNSGFTDRKGFVNLRDGATGTLLASWAGAPQDLLGSAVAAGDINGDGHADAILGARQASGSTGQVVVYSGVAPFGMLVVHASPKSNSSTMYGQSVAAANVNGDAYDDIIVGANEAGINNAFGAGFVEVLLGPDGTPAPYGPLAGIDIGDHFGFCVANAGDIAGDADAFDDILVGAPQFESGDKIGYVQVYDGLTGTLLRTLQGEQPKDYFGASVAGRLDFNGDGFIDFLVGAMQDQPNGKRGYVRVQSGKPGLAPPFLYRREGDKPSKANAGSGVGFGRAVARLGHTAPFTTESFVGTSAVYAGVGHAEVISGRNLLLTALPDSVSAGEIVSLVLAQLPESTSVLLLAGLAPAPTTIVPAFGVPLLPQPMMVDRMQPNEALVLSGTVPAGLSGLQVLVQYAGKQDGEPLCLSDIQTISF